MKKYFLLILMVLVVDSASYSLGMPENVLVVQNGNSPVSMRVAAHYMAARGVPTGNLITISITDATLSESAEAIAPANYTSQIEQPIRAFLTTSNLTNKIQYIVLTKGIPIKLTVDPTGGSDNAPPSVDSMLAGMDALPSAKRLWMSGSTVRGTCYDSGYWRSVKPFTHSEYGGYLVTRLDGYTEADAKALVDRALAAEAPTKYILFDEDPTWPGGLGDPAAQPKFPLLDNFCDFNAEMTRASQIIAGRAGVSTRLEQTAAFVGSPNQLTCYYSWGSNDRNYSQSTYRSLRFAPRSIVETAVSTGARSMFLQTSGQSQIADLIAQGAAGAKGYVSEPMLDGTASSTVLVDLYTSGRNLAESYYAASRYLRWKDIILGDPLCCLEGVKVTTLMASKALPDGTLVTIANKPVTAGTDDFGDRVYIEDTDRSSGIMVYLGAASPAVLRNATVTVRGILGQRNGEKCLTNAAFSSIVEGDISPLPLFMNNKTLGGEDWQYDSATGTGQCGITNGIGLSNIGLLVRTCGKFNYVDGHTFTIDDGSGVNVKCIVPDDVTLNPNWSNISVTGISSCEKAGNDLHRLLRIRMQDDVIPY